MKTTKAKLIKIILIFISTISIIAVITIFFISPITKFLIEKYDEKYTGRKITMNWAYVNPFTGYLYFNNLHIYEFKSDSIFFLANSVSTNIAMLKMLSKTYEISQITFNHPRGTIIKKEKQFNFNDLIERFSVNDSLDSTKAPIHFNILDIKINNGEFYYHEQLTPINYFIKNVNLESNGKHWNEDTISANFSFLSGIGNGDMKGDFTINLKNRNYHSALIIHKFDLNIIEQYLKQLTNYGSFRANIDANIKATGSFNDEKNITTSGMMAINDFHFGKNPKDDYASFDKLVLTMNEISPTNHTYFFDSISLTHPYFKYERYDYLDNLQTMFGKKGAKIKAANADAAPFNLVIEIGKYIQVLSKNFFKSNYKINRLAIDKGDFRFNDYSLSEKFSTNLNPLYVIADSIDRNNKRVNFLFESRIKPYGNVSVSLSINPKDSSDFDMQYHLQNIPASIFNPYIISYTSFPLDRGTIEINGKWNVKNGNILSKNHLAIIDPRVTERLRNKDVKWIPVPLIFFFILEPGNVIDYKIPISGNLKNPKFHLRDVLLDLLENIFVKAPTTPYRMEVKSTETEIEKSLTLKWEMRQSLLIYSQEKFIEKIADFLVRNPEAFITVSPQHYTIKEKEYILFFEAKKKYFLMTNHKTNKSFSQKDSVMVNKMSVKDSVFIHYLNKQTKGDMLFTIQEKCALLIDSTVINSKFEELNKERENAFMVNFRNKQVKKQIKIQPSQSVIPYNGFSFYKIKYNGELPKSLINAWQEMNKLNDEAPRKEFKKERKKNRITL
jgi:hypothetical protein